MTTDQRISENTVGEAQLEHDALYIGGRWRAARSRARFLAVNPDTEQPFGSFPDASAEDADDAVIAARTSFDDGRWRNASMQARAQVLARLADLYRASSADIAAVATAEMGCPISLSTMLNGALPQRQLDWFAELATTVEVEDTRDTPVGTYVIRREPVGVVAAVVPWNGPLYLAINKVIPALIAGCSVVLKPAPEASLGLLHFAKLAHTAGIPDGVLNVVTAGRKVGEHLVTHPLVDRVSFTGSTAAGRRIAALCGERLKHCGLELGGKSAALILDDADLTTTIEALKFASLANSGQICALQTRILVSDRRADEFVEPLSTAVRAMKVGDPSDPATEIGPLVSQRQRDRVEQYIDSGQREGATLTLGGGRPDRPAGWYVEPTIFTDVTNTMSIAREEIFGPVLAVIRSSTEGEAIALANDSEYGLAGGVWTTDTTRGLEIARQIRVGSGVNNAGSDVSVPFGGFKASGIGREGGPEGLDDLRRDEGDRPSEMNLPQPQEVHSLPRPTDARSAAVAVEKGPIMTQPLATGIAASCVGAMLVVGMSSAIPTAYADNKRLNDGVVANVYTIQHQAGCTNDVKINRQLQLAAQRHTDDMLNNRTLDGDTGSDGSTPQDRAAAAGFRGSVAETVAINPALAISGIEILQQWYDNPADLAIMQNCAYTTMGVWSENSLDRTVVVAVYGQPD